MVVSCVIWDEERRKMLFHEYRIVLSEDDRTELFCASELLNEVEGSSSVLHSQATP